MPEQERSDGPGEKGDAEGEIGVEGLGFRRRLRKEHGAEHKRRGCPENIEVVELDRGADEAREHDPARPGALGLRARPSLNRRRHGLLPCRASAWDGRSHGRFRARLCVFKRIGAFFCNCASGIYII